jgi:hypothetical protein
MGLTLYGVYYPQLTESSICTGTLRKRCACLPSGWIALHRFGNYFYTCSKRTITEECASCASSAPFSDLLTGLFSLNHRNIPQEGGGTGTLQLQVLPPPPGLTCAIGIWFRTVRVTIHLRIVSHHPKGMYAFRERSVRVHIKK